MGATAHALLSPSAAHRWLNCTAAPRLEEGIEDKGSDYAVEGTLAHAYCALKLKSILGLPTDAEVKEIETLYDRYYSAEMLEYVETYVTIVLEKFALAREKTPDAQLLVETRLDFSEYIPGAFGTGDAIIIADEWMDVIDFKYGKGVKVSAHQNPQMMIYALGAFDKFSFEYKITNVRMTIVQPRIDNLSEFEMTVEDLMVWTDIELRPKARMAFDGKGPQVPGEWCQFCKVKSTCRALANKCIAANAEHPDQKLLSVHELATAVLPLIATIKLWLAGVEDYALGQAMSGVELPGWKVVEGRSIRRVTNQEEAAKALNKAGYQDGDIFKPRELRTITELEKLTGKKQFMTICGDYIEKPAGKPTLAPDSDKRPAIDPVADDFKGVNI